MLSGLILLVSGLVGLGTTYLISTVSNDNSSSDSSSFSVSTSYIPGQSSGLQQSSIVADNTKRLINSIDKNNQVHEEPPQIEEDKQSQIEENNQSQEEHEEDKQSQIEQSQNENNKQEEANLNKQPQEEEENRLEEEEDEELEWNAELVIKEADRLSSTWALLKDIEKFKNLVHKWVKEELADVNKDGQVLQRRPVPTEMWVVQLCQQKEFDFFNTLYNYNKTLADIIDYSKKARNDEERYEIQQVLMHLTNDAQDILNLSNPQCVINLNNENFAFDADPVEIAFYVACLSVFKGKENLLNQIPGRTEKWFGERCAYLELFFNRLIRDLRSADIVGVDNINKLLAALDNLNVLIGNYRTEAGVQEIFDGDHAKQMATEKNQEVVERVKLLFKEFKGKEGNIKITQMRCKKVWNNIFKKCADAKKQQEGVQADNKQADNKDDKDKVDFIFDQKMRNEILSWNRILSEKELLTTVKAQKIKMHPDKPNGNDEMFKTIGKLEQNIKDLIAIHAVPRELKLDKDRLKKEADAAAAKAKAENAKKDGADIARNQNPQVEQPRVGPNVNNNIPNPAHENKPADPNNPYDALVQQLQPLAQGDQAEYVTSVINALRNANDVMEKQLAGQTSVQKLNRLVGDGVFTPLYSQADGYLDKYEQIFEGEHSEGLRKALGNLYSNWFGETTNFFVNLQQDQASLFFVDLVKTSNIILGYSVSFDSLLDQLNEGGLALPNNNAKKDFEKLVNLARAQSFVVAILLWTARNGAESLNAQALNVHLNSVRAAQANVTMLKSGVNAFCELYKKLKEKQQKKLKRVYELLTIAEDVKHGEQPQVELPPQIEQPQQPQIEEDDQAHVLNEDEE